MIVFNSVNSYFWGLGQLFSLLNYHHSSVELEVAFFHYPNSVLSSIPRSFCDTFKLDVLQRLIYFLALFPPSFLLDSTYTLSWMHILLLFILSLWELSYAVLFRKAMFSHNPIHDCYMNPDPICEMKKNFNYARLLLKAVQNSIT